MDGYNLELLFIDCNSKPGVTAAFKSIENKSADRFRKNIIIIINLLTAYSPLKNFICFGLNTLSGIVSSLIIFDIMTIVFVGLSVRMWEYYTIMQMFYLEYNKIDIW